MRSPIGTSKSGSVNSRLDSMRRSRCSRSSSNESAPESDARNRLFDAIAPADMAATLRVLEADDRSAATTTKALAYLDQLFVTPASTGTRLAVEALRTVLPEATVTAAVTAYLAKFRRALDIK